MSQVSRRIVRAEVQEKIIETLLEAIAQLKNKQDIQAFVNDLLTPVERIMIAKRLAIAVLLLKGWSYDATGDLLKVSTDTIARISIILKTNDGYKKTADHLMKTEAGREFWRDVASLAYRLGTPGKTFVDEGLIRHKLGFKKKTLI